MDNHQVVPANHQPVDLLQPKYHTYSSFLRPSNVQNPNSTDRLKGRTSYRWSFCDERPPNSSLAVSDIQGSRSTIAWFQPDVPGLYSLNLAVKGHGCTYSDPIKIRVVDLDSENDAYLLNKEDLDQDFYVIGYRFSDKRPSQSPGPVVKSNPNTTALKKQISSKKANSSAKDKILGTPPSHKKNQLQKDTRRRKKPTGGPGKSAGTLPVKGGITKNTAKSKLSAKGRIHLARKKAHDYDDDDNDADESGGDDDDEQIGKGGGYEDDDDEDLEGLESGDEDDENLGDAPGGADEDNEGEDDGGDDDGGNGDEGGDDDDGDQGEDHDDDEEEEEEDNEIEIEEEEEEDGDDEGEGGGGQGSMARGMEHDMEEDEEEGVGMYDEDDGDEGEEEGEDDDIGRGPQNLGGDEEEEDDDMMDGDDYDQPQDVMPEDEDDEEGDGDGDGDGGGNEGGNDEDDEDDEDEEDDEDVEE